MKVVFMGTPVFAVEILRKLHEEFNPVSAVVTQPDRPKGRGNVITPPPVKIYAQDRGIPVLQPEKIIDSTEALRRISPDVIVVAAFGQLLPKTILDLPPLGCVNAHASLLPKYRGAAPINRAIMNGETVTGVTIMLMDEGIDTGPILMFSHVQITHEDTSDLIHDKLAKLGAVLIPETLRNLDNIIPKPQDNSLATYAPIMKKEEGRIDWKMPVHILHNHIRGCSPWPGAFTFHKENMLKIIKADFISTEQITVASEQTPGTVFRAGPSAISVIASGGRVYITEIQREGKKAQSVSSFLNGYPLERGEMFE